VITADELAENPKVRHGFFDRTGGVSCGIYAALNCGFGSDDERDDVAENRRRVAATLGLEPERLCTLYQIHSADVVVVTDPGDTSGRRADAMVTATPDIALGVLTADCAPVLFADAEAQVVGAAHAGWKGALAGVAEATVAAMEGLGARKESIAAVIGPCIAPASYEVGPEFRARFVEVDPGNRAFFEASKRTGHAMFDLPGYLMSRLGRLGLKSARWTGQDTCADAERFFSYRRAVLRGEPDYGRMVGAISLASGG
jgi:purine-nucleoside/S-methyl-5'-thioadenosine phosphorylase / adenosine deaminase